jgi:hypothetical protein
MAALASLISSSFSLVESLIKAHRINEWTKLIFSFVFSYATTFSFVCGTALAAGKSCSVAIGSGMVSGGVVVTYLFRRSPLTKELFVALPADEANKEMDTDLQTLQRAK